MPKQDKHDELTANFGPPPDTIPDLPIPSFRPIFEETNGPLHIVRALGFNTSHKITAAGSTTEEVLFFIGPSGEQSFEATDMALKEFQGYLKHTLETVELYVANHKNNNTHEWPK
jgi:hypothetical protein